MKILVAPQELKGTLTAVQAAEAIAAGISAVLPNAQLDIAPIADGGPGTVDAFAMAAGAERVEAGVEDPLGRTVRAAYAVGKPSHPEASGAMVAELQTGLGPSLPLHPALNENLAVIEMAAASGLWRLQPSEYDARKTSTRGAGQLIASALDRGCREIWVGLGGSATNDAGAGALTALGAKLLDESGAELPPGGEALARLHRLDVSKLDPRIREVRLVGLMDVRAPLLGPTGATRVFAAQKGADEFAMAELEKALTRFHEVVKASIRRDLWSAPGTGAAGGLGYALCAVLGARLRSGFFALADLLHLPHRVRRADLVITAEGRFDAQSAMGKGPGALAELSRASRKPSVMLAGSITSDAPRGMFTEARPLLAEAKAKGPVPSSAEARRMLEMCAREAASRFSTLLGQVQD